LGYKARILGLGDIEGTMGGEDTARAKGKIEIQKQRAAAWYL
jgi:hypothetical protein